jgi:phosphate-selective porin OprO/OprP
MKRYDVVKMMVVVGTVVWSQPTWADSSEQRVEALDQKVRILERKLELAAESTQAKAQDAAVVAAGREGFGLSSADKAFKLKLRGYIQADGQFYLRDESKPLTDTFLLRRVRPIFEGTVYRDFDFKIMPDFGGGKAVLYDAYLDYHADAAVNLRAGKFKPPVGLERLQSATDLRFVERALPTALVPTRDVGLQLYGDLLGGTLSYAAGIFNGVPDGASADVDYNNGKEFAGRLFATPFKNTDVEGLKTLGFGVSGSYGKNEGSLVNTGLSALKSGGQQTFFSYLSSTNLDGTVVADGIHSRVSPQAYYYWDSFGLLGEYVASSQEISKGKNRDTLVNTAWQIQGSYVLTGEKASYKGVTPTHAFDWRKGDWGAFEIVARYNELAVDSKTFPTYADNTKSASKAKAVGAGVNWYLNKDVKVVLDFEQTRFTDGSKKADRETENALFTRLQVAF